MHWEIIAGKSFSSCAPTIGATCIIAHGGWFLVGASYILIIITPQVPSSIYYLVDLA